MTENINQRSQQRRRSRPITPARRVAFEVLMAVEQDDAYANLALPAKIKQHTLSSNDAGLATELTYGTLRMQGFYDTVIANAAARDVESIDLVVLTILRLGVHQLLNMRIAPHAAVDESVNLAEHMASRGAIGFVNAVLRRTSRHDLADWQEFVTRGITSTEERLAIVHSHPLWIVRSLKQSLEAEGRGEELEALLAADNVNPRVTLVELPGFVDTNDEVEGEPTQYSPLGISLNSGETPPVLRGYERAWFGFRTKAPSSQHLHCLGVPPHKRTKRGWTCVRVLVARRRFSLQKLRKPVHRSLQTKSYLRVPILSEKHSQFYPASR